MLSRLVRTLVAPLLLTCGLLAAQEPQTQAPRRLNLVIVEGEGAINNIKLRTARETIVQVEDENHKPVAAAAVVFLLPDNGPGGTFVTGSKSATVVTDSSGRSVMPRVQLNSSTGKFEIKVHASHEGLEASATIAQTSVAAGAAVGTGTIIGIIVGVAAAGAVAAVVASKGKSSSSTTSTTPAVTPTGTIGAGSGVIIGPPPR